MHPKIQELKRRAKAIEYSSVSVGEAGELNERESLLDKRIVEGYAVIWGKRNMHGEIFVKGCFAKSIREHGPNSNSNYQIKFMSRHGNALALFEELKEDDIGLYFRTKPLDPITEADEVLVQLRSGTLNNYSQGFNYIWDKLDWEEATESIIVREGVLFELSVVDIPSGLDTYTIRSLEDVEFLADETEYFIKSLPRNKQLEARQLFARHKSLMNLEPLEQRAKTLAGNKPNETGIDIQFLIENL